MDISIIVPVYNVELFLNECLESLSKQLFNGQYEIICINDGSTDKSKEILEKYEENDSKIKIINQKNKGLSGARNTGIRHAVGKYIMFIDSDDYLKHNEVLKNMYEEAEENRTDILIADFEYDFEDKSKNFRMNRSNLIKNKVMSGRNFYDIGFKKKSIMSVVWNKLYRRDFILKNNLSFIEGILYEDMEFTPRAFYLAERVKYVDNVAYMYRQREGSIMSTKNNRINDYFIIADRLRLFNKNYSSEVLRTLELYIYVTIIKKLKFIEDMNQKNLYYSYLRDRDITSKFLASSKLKYKIFILLFLLRTLKK